MRCSRPVTRSAHSRLRRRSSSSFLLPRRGGATDFDRFQDGYDRNGNVLYKKNMVNGAFSELYHVNGSAGGYDKLNRLTDFRRGVLSDTNADGVPDTIATASASNTWSLDAIGNWATIGGVAQSYNSENQITSNGMTYDANGNMTRDETGKGFVYSAWNKLVTLKAADGSTVMTYKTDALGRRVSANGQNFYYSKNWQVIQDGFSLTLRQYVWSLAYVDAMVLRDFNQDGNMGTGNWGKDGSGLDLRMYPMQDANWNVTGLVWLNGATPQVMERYLYDPYGKFTCYDSNWALTVAPQTPRWAWFYLHQGGRWDATAGLYHFRNRDFSPTLGRWMTEDPAGYVDGGSLYQAYGSSPVGGVDPWGLEAMQIYDDFSPFDGLDRWRHGNGRPVYIVGTTFTAYMARVPQVRSQLDEHRHAFDTKIQDAFEALGLGERTQVRYRSTEFGASLPVTDYRWGAFGNVYHRVKADAEIEKRCNGTIKYISRPRAHIIGRDDYHEFATTPAGPREVWWFLNWGAAIGNKLSSYSIHWDWAEDW